MVEVSEIIVHKADQPNLLADLFDADALAGEDEVEIDLPPIEADTATRGTVAILSWNGQSNSGRGT